VNENHRKLTAILLCLLVLALPYVETASGAANVATAGSVIDRRDHDIQQLMKVTGVDDFLAQLPDLVEAGLFMWVQSQQGVSRDQIEKIKKLISEFFNQEYFKDKLKQYFKTKYDGLRFKKVTQLFRTPLSQQMILLENELRTEQGMAALQKYPDQLAKQAPTPQRAELIAKLSKVSHSSEVILTTQLQILKNILLVGSSMAKPESSLSLNQINAILEQANSQIGQQVIELVIVSFLFTYREASDLDLQNYVEFYNNESLQWYFKLYLKGLDSIFMDIPSELALLIKQN